MNNGNILMKSYNATKRGKWKKKAITKEKINAQRASLVEVTNIKFDEHMMWGANQYLMPGNEHPYIGLHWHFFLFFLLRLPLNVFKYYSIFYHLNSYYHLPAAMSL